MTAAPDRLPALTALRFFAALHVVFYHLHVNGHFRAVAEAESGWAGLVRGLLESGYASVSLFFVLSGFILVHAHRREPLLERDERVRFWIARFARLYPVYLLGILAMVPFMIWLVASGQKSLAVALGALPLNLLLVQSWLPPAALSWNGPGWSLSVEVLFYLLFPLLLPFLRKRSLAVLAGLAAAAWLLGLAVPLAYTLLAPDGLAARDWSHAFFSQAPLLVSLKVFPLLRLHEFLLGAVVGLLFVRHGGAWLGRGALPVALGAALLYLGLLATAADSAYILLHNGLLAPVFALLIFALASVPGGGPVAAGSWLERLGQSSYALYLLHGPGLLYFHLLARQASVEFPYAPGLSLALTVALAALSLAVFRGYEEPWRRRLQGGLWQRWCQRQAARDPAAAVGRAPC